MLMRSPPRRQRGLSIVELMVGVTIGLLVVAASALVVSGQLVDNRRLLLETQIQQDLRAATDIIVRELRRAGTRPDAEIGGVWSTVHPNPDCNRHATVTAGGPPDGFVQFRYYRDASNNSPIGIKVENGVLRTAVHTATPVTPTVCQQDETPVNFQDLTDARTLKITAFGVEALPGSSQTLPCPRLCADGTRDCWPQLDVRPYRIVVSGEAVADPAVKRTLTAVVRLRNDNVRHEPPTATQMCP